MPTNDGPVTSRTPGPTPGPPSIQEAVLGWIARGTLHPGAFLAASDLLDRTHAAPDVVAEALQDLVDRGVAEPAPGGVVIAHPTPGDMADTDEVRHLLEEVAVRRFVAQASDTQIAALHRAMAAVERIADTPEPSIRQLIRARDWFFAVILRSPPGLVTGDLLRTLRPHAGLVMSVAVAGPDRPAELVAELRAICHALATRDADAAIAACDRHRRNGTAAALQQLQLNG